MPFRLRHLIQEGGVSHRQSQHPFHQINAIDFLRHAMLHLQPGVHLEEVKGTGVRIIDKLHRAGGAVLHRFTQLARSVSQGGANLIGKPWGRGFFHHLLIATLGRAVALHQRRHPALAIAKQLHLDVPCAAHELLQEDAAIVEVVLAQPRHHFVAVAKTGIVFTHAHADAAAPGRALQHHRITDSLRRRHGFVRIG